MCQHQRFRPCFNSRVSDSSAEMRGDGHGVGDSSDDGLENEDQGQSSFVVSGVVLHQLTMAAGTEHKRSASSLSHLGDASRTHLYYYRS